MANEQRYDMAGRDYSMSVFSDNGKKAALHNLRGCAG